MNRLLYQVLPPRYIKSLLKQIDEHRDCGMHAKAMKHADQAKSKELEKDISSQQTLYEQRRQNVIAATEKVFCTAYMNVQNQIYNFQNILY